MIVGDGIISFLGENWVGSILHVSLPCDIKLSVHASFENIHDFVPLVPTSQRAAIRCLVLKLNVPDPLVLTNAVEILFD